MIEVSDADSFAFTRRLAREEALLVGGSCGMAAWAARQVAQELAAEGRTDAVVVVLLPDSGRGYLTKIFNDEWLAQYGFATARRPTTARSARCCAASPAGCPTWSTPTPARPSPRRSTSSRSTASARCPSCAPSRRSWPPRSPGRSPSAPCSTRSSPAPQAHRPGRGPHVRPLPTIGSTEAATDAVTLLSGADAVLVHEDGKPIGVLTRQDLLTFVAAP